MSTNTSSEGAARKGGPSASYVDRTPAMPPIVVDHDAGTVTFAVTFTWARPWALDHCEVGVLRGELWRAIIDHFGDDAWDQLAALAAVQTWEPNEERHIGDPMRSPSYMLAGGRRLAREAVKP